MLKKLQWYNIAIKLRDFLKSYRYKNGNRLFEYLVDRDDFKIRVGSGNTGDYPALWILFGDESQVEKQDSRVGASIQLWIDIFAKAEANPEIDYDDNCYRQIFKMEEELCSVLREFNLELHKLGLGTNLKILAIMSDGDSNVPVSLQHRIVLEIEWYK